MKSKRPGITLVELLLYMALSGIVVLSMVTFLSNMFQARTALASQTKAQEQARTILERMTIAIRHGYDVEVAGNMLTVYTRPANDPEDTVYSVFKLEGQQLKTGSGDNLSTITLQSMTPPTLTVTAFTVSKVSSAVDLQLTVESANRKASLQSVIAFRQI